MPVEKRIEVGVINITMERHKSLSYIDLFKDLVRHKLVIAVRGETRATLVGREINSQRNPSVMKKVEGRAFSGFILRYNELSDIDDWYNIETRDGAAPEDLKQVNIPNHLKPHLKQFRFVFYENSHKLAYEVQGSGKAKITPRAMSAILEKLFSAPEIVEKYGTVAVTHMTDQRELAQILDSKRSIRKVMLQIKRPNADGSSKIDAEVLRRMEEQNLESLEQTMKSPRDESIVVDNDLRDSITFTSDNGMVEIYGKDSNRHSFKFASNNHPLTKKEYFNPRSEVEEGVFFRVAKALYNKVKNRGR